MLERKIQLLNKKFYQMKYVLLQFILLGYIACNAQHKCMSQHIYNEKLNNNPLLREIHRESEATMSELAGNTSNKTNAVITIPVVVHVVYNTPTQNISETQIREQIRVLNEDYRKRNADTLASTHAFYSFIGDAEYEFCLATTDPSGNPTNGITRTFTTTTGFDADVNFGSDVKFNITGGRDNWNPNQYLNVWVCNLINGTLGYATFPDELAMFPEEDGVVIGYTYFSRVGTSVAPYNKGRTLTHETGHWLGLLHPCEMSCDDDFVSDTKPCQELNYGCPTFPHNPNNACGGDANGEMFMNFMEYVDDACMNMFTKGQVTRMHNQQSTNRTALATANKCVSTASINDEEKIKYSIYPNPTQDVLEIYLGNEQNFKKPTLRISDAIGNSIFETNFDNTNSLTIDVSKYSNGSYYVTIEDNQLKTSKLFTILH
jgi:hypothetical protein